MFLFIDYHLERKKFEDYIKFIEQSVFIPLFPTIRTRFFNHDKLNDSMLVNIHRQMTFVNILNQINEKNPSARVFVRTHENVY